MQTPLIFSRHLASICIGLGLAAASSAQTYYVAPNGSDQRTAAEATNRETPFRTFRRATDEIRDGGQIVALDGAYDLGDGGPAPEPNTQSRLRLFAASPIDSGGVANANPVIIRSENKFGAKLRGILQVEGFRDFTFEGFDTDTAGEIVLGQTRPIFEVSFSRCDRLTVRDCRIIYGGFSGLIIGRSDTVLVEWNLISRVPDIGRDSTGFAGTGLLLTEAEYRSVDAPQYGIRVRNNTIFDCKIGLNTQTGESFRGEYDRPVMIENNLIFDCQTAWLCFQSSNLRFRNNTLSRVGDPNSLLAVRLFDSDRIYIYNNIIDPIPGFGSIGAGPSVTDSLIFSNSLAGPIVGRVAESFNRFGDPQLDPSTFAPSPNSDAVDGAFDAGDHSPLDVRGLPRFSGPLDRGAIERQSAD